ncbi:hypothetical protein KSS87_012941, partial [Heliosperma pusillum]
SYDGDYAAEIMIGASGLLGRSWPDLDMLPLGWLAVPGSNQGPCRKCDLNIEEQKTMFPLVADSDASKNQIMWNIVDNGTLINSYSDSAVPEGIRSWIATGRRGEVYIALFNLNQEQTVISVQLSILAETLHGVNMEASYKCIEVWNGQDCQINEASIFVDVEPHGAALLVLTSNILVL